MDYSRGEPTTVRHEWFRTFAIWLFVFLPGSPSQAGTCPPSRAGSAPHLPSRCACVRLCARAPVRAPQCAPSHRQNRKHGFEGPFLEVKSFGKLLASTGKHVASYGQAAGKQVPFPGKLCFGTLLKPCVYCISDRQKFRPSTLIIILKGIYVFETCFSGSCMGWCTCF